MITHKTVTYYYLINTGKSGTSVKETFNEGHRYTEHKIQSNNQSNTISLGG